MQCPKAWQTVYLMNAKALFVAGVALHILDLGTVLGPRLMKADLHDAYRKLALELHPDRTGGADEVFVTLRKISERQEASSQPCSDVTSMGNFGFNPNALEHRLCQLATQRALNRQAERDHVRVAQNRSGSSARSDGFAMAVSSVCATQTLRQLAERSIHFPEIVEILDESVDLSDIFEFFNAYLLSASGGWLARAREHAAFAQKWYDDLRATLPDVVAAQPCVRSHILLALLRVLWAWQSSGLAWSLLTAQHFAFVSGVVGLGFLLRACARRIPRKCKNIVHTSESGLLQSLYLFALVSTLPAILERTGFWKLGLAHAGAMQIVKGPSVCHRTLWPHFALMLVFLGMASHISALRVSVRSFVISTSLLAALSLEVFGPACGDGIYSDRRKSFASPFVAGGLMVRAATSLRIAINVEFAHVLDAVGWTAASMSFGSLVFWQNVSRQHRTTAMAACSRSGVLLLIAMYAAPEADTRAFLVSLWWIVLWEAWAMTEVEPHASATIGSSRIVEQD